MKKLKILVVTTFLLISNVVNAAFPDDLSDVKFVHNNISNWPVTSALNVSVGGGVITLDYDKNTTWPRRSSSLCTGCNANPWIIVKFNGQWWAGTFEWFRYGQISKPVKVVNGDHIKGGPFGFTWKPKNGETYGFMVSGFARFPENLVASNVKERTNIVLYKWGEGPVPTNPVEPEPEPEPEKTLIIPPINLLLN